MNGGESVDGARLLSSCVPPHCSALRQGAPELRIVGLTRRGVRPATAMIVIEGLKGQPVAELWSAHPLSQAPYEQGRDPFWAHPANACEGQAASRLRGSMRGLTLGRGLDDRAQKSTEGLG